jgi:hypothetical protein
MFVLIITFNFFHGFLHTFVSYPQFCRSRDTPAAYSVIPNNNLQVEYRFFDSLTPEDSPPPPVIPVSIDVEHRLLHITRALC